MNYAIVVKRKSQKWINYFDSSSNLVSITTGKKIFDTLKQLKAKNQRVYIHFNESDTLLSTTITQLKDDLPGNLLIEFDPKKQQNEKILKPQVNQGISGYFFEIKNNKIKITEEETAN